MISFLSLEGDITLIRVGGEKEEVLLGHYLENDLQYIVLTYVKADDFFPLKEFNSSKIVRGSLTSQFTWWLEGFWEAYECFGHFILKYVQEGRKS